MFLILLLDIWLAYKMHEPTGRPDFNVISLIVSTLPFGLMVDIGSYCDYDGMELGYAALLIGGGILIFALTWLAFFMLISGGPYLALLVFSPALPAFTAVAEGIKAKRQRAIV